jgi:hypothetical protein
MRSRWFELLVMAALSCLASNALAAWTIDPGPAGLLVRSGGSPRSVVSDGAGGALIGFGTYFGSNTVGDIVVQKLDDEGLVPWGTDGVTAGVIGAIAGDYGPWMATDGSGGAILVWRGPTGVLFPKLHGQRVSAGGSLQWTPASPGEGLYLADVPSSILPVWVGGDAAGGFIVVWYQSPANLYAQRFDVNGTTFWGPQGLSLGISAPSVPGVVSDGGAGMIVFWSGTGPGGDRDLFTQRFGRDGAPMWTPGGVPICSASGDQGNGQPGITAVPDGAGGAIVVWLDQRTDANSDVYAQHVNGSGALQWAANGQAICDVPGPQSVVAAVPDGAGGVIATWQDGRDPSTAPDLYAQRISSNGLVQWMAGGAPVCVAAGAQFEDPTVPGPSVCFAADGSGGMFAAWTDSRPDASPGNDIFAQHLDGSGTAIWPATGLRFGATSATLARPAIMPDGTGGCAVLWAADFALQARGSSGPITGVGPGLESGLALRGAFPNPSLGRFSIAFSLLGEEPARIDVMDVSGRRLWSRNVAGAGAHTESVRALRPGLYLVRLRQGSRVATSRAVVID